MTSTTKKASSKSAQRDAYDDFLDGVMSSGEKKSASGKKKSSSGGSKSASAGVGKNGGAGKPQSSEKRGSKTTAGTKSKTTTKKKTTSAAKAEAVEKSKTTASKTNAVEAGIVSLGSRGAAARKTSETKTASTKTSAGKKTGAKSSAGGHSAKHASSRGDAAVLVVDNPVARRNGRSGTRTRPSAGNGSQGRRRASGEVRRSGSSSRAASRSGNVRRMDRDDLFHEHPPTVRKKKTSGSGKKGSGKKRSRKKGKRLTGWDIFFSAGIVCMLGFMLWQGTQYSDFLMMKQAVDRQTYYPGTTIEGMDVSGMTLEAAVEYWQTQVEPRYADRTVVFEGGESVKASQLGYSSDYMTVLTNAWSAGRSGSLEERYQAIASRSETPVAYSVTRTPYTDEMVDRFVAYAAEKVDTPATEAKIESFDLKKYKFVFSEPQPGKKLDQAALKASVTQMLDAGGGSVEMVINDIEPATTVESVSSKYGMITSAITNASSSSKNRLTNIKLSLEIINGTRLKPGETFSFNGVVGERTKARGFKEATAYSSGEVTEQVGGGICQVSTTLFNAAVKADLDIVERHNHSLTVGYVDKGKDAAVNWGSQDLRFTNNTDDDIYICCYLTSDKRVRFGIFGKLLPDGETITVEGVTTGDIEYETEYQPSGLLAPGEQIVLQSGKKGYTAEAYKLRWNAKGKLISRELLCTSKYKAVKEIVQYGP